MMRSGRVDGNEEKGRERERNTNDCSTYQSQLLQHGLFDTALLEIDSRTVDHLLDDGLVNTSHGLVRHVGSAAWSTPMSPD